MNVIFHRFNNLISPLVHGKDHVCACMCGRYQDYHVVPYAPTMVDPREIHFLNGTLSLQAIDVITGLLLGLCIGWFLLMLHRVLLSVLDHWREYKMINEEFCDRRMYKSIKKNRLLRMYRKHTEDSTGNNVYIDQDAYHNDNNTIVN